MFAKRAICLAAIFAAFAACAAPSAHADLSGFSQFAPVNTYGTTNTANVSADGGTLTLTDGNKAEATSAFAPTPQRITSWTATFTYQGNNFGGPAGGTGGADGVAFVLQNDPRGVKALGYTGNSLGYSDNGAITKSVAFRINLYQDAAGGIVTGGATGEYNDTGSVDLRSQDPIQITLTYDGAVLTENYKDLKTGDTAESEEAVNIPAAVGGSAALVGFTGGSGDATATQTVRDFSFKVLPDVPPSQRKHLTVKVKTYKTLADYVNPLIGTDNGGNTFPGASMPFGMTQFSPDTNAPSIGYAYPDRHIQGFSLNHMSGVGCNDEGDVFLMPTTGAVATDMNDDQSSYSHHDEDASPGYYRVHLLRDDIQAELTATVHTGVARFTFPKGKAANILIPISHTLTQTYGAQVHIVGDHEIDGQVTSQSFCGAGQRYTVYFVMQVDQPFKTYGTWAGATVSAGSQSAAQADQNAPAIGAYVTYPDGLSKPVTARIGISYVDLAGARANLQAEAARHGFDDIRKQAASAWNKELGVVQVQGGTTDQRVTFYTSLYHALLMPSVYSDVDGRYMGFDDKIHQKTGGHAAYANYSGWDIYRTEMPLLCLIEPQRVQDMCQSIVDMYQQGGWIDRWPQLNTYTNVMCGSPLTIIMANAWADGLRGFDMTTGYEGMFKDAMTAPPPGKPYGGESNVGNMNTVGYIPDDKEGYGSVSQTEEDCIAYAALATVAQSLGKISDATMLRARALNYRNLFDSQTLAMRPKLLNGSWYAPFDLAQEHGYVEGSGWHYRWLAPQDEAGLIHLFGGDDSFNAALDQFFAYPHVEWNDRFYNPYNETDLEAPFLYDYSGEPWKTQARVRELQADAYGITPSGIPGNDDCGVMSSWYVLSALGLYAVNPSDGTFELTSPLFPKATIHLSAPYTGSSFVINAPAATADHPYIESARLGKYPLIRPWVTQQQISQGGSLTFDLGTDPNKDWGAAAMVRPPSISQ